MTIWARTKARPLFLLELQSMLLFFSLMSTPVAVAKLDVKLLPWETLIGHGPINWVGDERL